VNFSQLDIQIFYSINGLAGRWPELDALMKSLSRPGTYLVPGVLAFAFWFWQQRRQAIVSGLVLAALIFAVDSLSFGVKQLVARPRPCRALPEVKQIVGCGRAYSFPSNHTVNTAAGGIFFQLLYPKTGYFVWPFVGMIGFNRVYVGSHYVTDVLGGWIVAAFYRRRLLPQSKKPSASENTSA